MITVICPFYNEEENLTELYDRLKKVLEAQSRPYEILFVNDGSTDGGGAIVDSLAAKVPQVRVVHLDGRFGLSSALLAGFHNAKGEILLTLDSDLQNPPEEIPRLMECIDQYDIVTGIRARRQDSWVRLLSSKIANAARRRATGDHIEDIGCSLRAFHRKTLHCFLPYIHMHRFFLAFAEREGYSIKQVTVAHAPRKAGKSKYGIHNRLWQGLLDLLAVRWMLNRKIHYKIKEGE